MIVPSDLQKMRQLFPLMSKSEKNVLALKDISQQAKDVLPSLKKAYYAAALMASAQYKFNPLSKLSVFNEGKKILNESVSTDALNIEIRYIRFTIQSNSPSFLGYNKEIDEDKKFILNNLKNIKVKDSELFDDIYEYLLIGNKLTPEEKQKING